MDPIEQSQVLLRLREAVEQARASYERAKQEFAQAQNLGVDLGSIHPDGSLRLSIRSETEARRQYRQALWTFNRFVLDGKLPEDQNPAAEI